MEEKEADMGTLKIRDNSLLWRYYIWLADTPLNMKKYNLSLCGFTQRLFWGSVTAFIAIAAISGVFWSMGYAIFAFFYYGWSAAWSMLGSKKGLLGFQYLLPVGMAFWTFIFVIIVAVALVRFIENRNERKMEMMAEKARNSETYITPKNLFWEWLKAKKDKICPLIEVVHAETASK